MKQHLKAKAVLALMALLLPSGSPAAGFTALHAFGDSLTDTGSIFAWPPSYYDWQFSNGRLWVEQLCPKLGFAYNQNNNHAVAGTETSGALSQARNLSAPANASSALFALWSGGNDFLNGLGQGTNDIYWSSLVAVAVNNLSNAVEVLYGKGARSLLVLNLPDLGKTPRLRNGYSPAFQAYITERATQFNGALETALDGLQQSRPDLRIFAMDVFRRVSFLMTNLGLYGFSVGTIGALQDPALADRSFTGPGSAYLFWDEIHPTGKAHGLIADWVVETLTAVNGVRLGCQARAGALNLRLDNLETARIYRLQTSTNLLHWEDFQSFVATNGVWSFPVQTANISRAFYRVKD